MTRAVLCSALTGLTVLLALGTALVQNQNRAKGLQLDALKERCSMLEAINGDRLEQVLESDWGPLPFTPRQAEHGTQAPGSPRGAPAARGGARQEGVP